MQCVSPLPSVQYKCHRQAQKQIQPFVYSLSTDKFAAFFLLELLIAALQPNSTLPPKVHTRSMYGKSLNFYQLFISQISYIHTVSLVSIFACSINMLDISVNKYVSKILNLRGCHFANQCENKKPRQKKEEILQNVTSKCNNESTCSGVIESTLIPHYSLSGRLLM